MRVGFDTTVTLLAQSGVTRSVLDLASALDRVDEVDVVRLRHGVRAARGVPDRIVRGLARELVYYPAGLGRRARAANVDLVHCPAHFAPRAVGRPVVLTIHDTLVWRRPELFTSVNALHGRLLVGGAARRADRVVTCSEYVARQIVELLRVDPDRVAVTPWGVSERFRPVELDLPLLARLGLRQPYVLAVGTLSPRKNLVTTLRAFARLARDRPGLGLAAVGPRGWGTAEIDAAVRAAPPGVVLTGQVPDDELVALYSGAACLVFPSLEEGFGFPPLEAMACGTPVVASNTSSIPEVVGDAALLVEPLDDAALAAAVTRVLDETGLAADLRRRGLERARRFSWDASARATVDVYRAALG